MKRDLHESPLYRIFRETSPDELKEFFAPAMRAAKEDQKAISARAKEIRAARETPGGGILAACCPGSTADEISDLLKPYLKEVWEEQQAIHARAEAIRKQEEKPAQSQSQARAHKDPDLG